MFPQVRRCYVALAIGSPHSAGRYARVDGSLSFAVHAAAHGGVGGSGAVGQRWCDRADARSGSGDDLIDSQRRRHAAHLMSAATRAETCHVLISNCCGYAASGADAGP